MKNIILLGLLTTLISHSFGQVCNADFNYTINNGNVVLFIDSSTSSCPSWNGCCLYFNYGDTASGGFNTTNPFGTGFNHFYKNPGIYTVCETISYQDLPCTCIDSTCYQITITNTGSNCQAAYCYTVTTDSTGIMEVIFENISSADDSITNVFWEFGDGSQSTQFTNVQHFYFYPSYYLCRLFINASSGCQSVFTDTIFYGINGTNCDTTQTSASQSIFPQNEFLKIHPSVIHNRATITTNLSGGQIMLYIYDLFGRQIKQVDVTVNRTLERNNIQSGIYIYRATVDNITFQTGKLLFD